MRSLRAAAEVGDTGAAPFRDAVPPSGTRANDRVLSRGATPLSRLIGVGCLGDVFTGSGRDYRGRLGVVLVGLGTRLRAV